MKLHRRGNEMYVGKITRAILLALMFVFTPLLHEAHAQHPDRGLISGIVKDSTGALVTDADVRVANSHHVVLASTRTDAQGRFHLNDIPSGTHVLTVSRTGFDRQRTLVQVTAGQTTDVGVLLQINPLSEEVTVTAEAGQVLDARNVAQPINIIGEREILNRAPEVVAQVVDEEPGVNLQRTSPSLSAVFVRGLTGRNVAVYVDGVRYTTSAQRGGVGTFLA